jgi:hypothetical protein
MRPPVPPLVLALLAATAGGPAGAADGSAEEEAGPGERPRVGGVPGGAAFAAWTDREGGERFAWPVVAGSASGVVFAAWERVGPDPAGTRVEGAVPRAAASR